MPTLNSFCFGSYARDVFFGLSVKGAVTKAMVKSMADKPIIFAMANPDPEITPEEAHAVRPERVAMGWQVHGTDLREWEGPDPERTYAQPGGKPLS